jgi:rhodanese-related sulfurtransferase
LQKNRIFIGIFDVMAQFVEFVGNNLILVGLWVALLVAFLLHHSKTGSQAVGTQQAVMLINRKDGVVLDIRDKKDYEAGHIVDSIHIPLAKLSSRLAELEKYKDKPVIVVCKMGQHSGDACKTLANAGFTEVVRLRGGMVEWRAQNLPLVQK